MSKITKILSKIYNGEERIQVYIDDKYCTSVRKRTWIGMNLNLGSNISCEEVITLENNFWKKLYGVKSWELEKKRIRRIEGWFGKYIPEVSLNRIGFGADHNEYIKNIHSIEPGSPDLSISYDNQELIRLEVSGTERMRGDDYWVRKDKVDYIQKNKDIDIWIVLHYQLPKEKFIWIKVSSDKKYNSNSLNLKGAGEYYITFDNSSTEIQTSRDFRNYLRNKIQSISLSAKKI